MNKAQNKLTADMVCDSEYENECNAIEAEIRAVILSGRSFHELEIGKYNGEETLISAILRSSVLGTDVKALAAALVRLVIVNRIKDKAHD